MSLFSEYKETAQMLAARLGYELAAPYIDSVPFVRDFIERVRDTRDPVYLPMLYNLENKSQTHTNEFFTLQHFLHNWLVYNMPVFRLSPSVFSGFALTDVEDAHDVRLPFPAFFIETPKNFWFFEGIRNRTTVPMELIQISSYMMPSREDPLVLEEAIRYDILGRDGSSLYYKEAMSQFLTAVLHYDNTLTEQEQRFLDGARNVILNLCLFSEYNKNEIKKAHADRPAKLIRKKKKGQKKQKTKLKGATIWVVGSNIKLDAKVIEDARSLVPGRGFSVKRRFTVRGHWRNQPHGPGRKLRKKIWIQPHWKGPKEAERLSHLYTLGDDE